MAVGRQRPWFTTIGKCQITNLCLSQWSGHDLVQTPRHGRFLYEPKVPIVASSGFQLNSPERKKEAVAFLFNASLKYHAKKTPLIEWRFL